VIEVDMALSNQDKKLLNDIFSASLKSPKGLNAARFRADNEQFITELDQLESLGYLQRRDDLYSITLLAFAYLAKDNPDARKIAKNCGLIFDLLKGHYRDNLRGKIEVPNIVRNTGISLDDVILALGVIIQAPILGGHTSDLTQEHSYIIPSERILKYKAFEDILKEREEWDKHKSKQNHEYKKLPHVRPDYPLEQEASLSATSSAATWKAIESEFGITKKAFGRSINFVSDRFRRNIIFRDVEHSFVLASLGFSKPAVILAGGVIEELLRQYLKHKNIEPIKNDFDGYIQTCEKEGLLKKGISLLSDSARHFRNIVHLSKEETKRHTISKPAAKGAVSSIFTIANDF
jgi:hypothetical protein